LVADFGDGVFDGFLVHCGGVVFYDGFFGGEDDGGVGDAVQFAESFLYGACAVYACHSADVENDFFGFFL